MMIRKQSRRERGERELDEEVLFKEIHTNIYIIGNILLLFVCKARTGEDLLKQVPYGVFPSNWQHSRTVVYLKPYGRKQEKRGFQREV